MKKLTKTEEKLLRQQAEAYAFIRDLREAAAVVGDLWVIRKTEGIDEKIKRRKEEYPELFQHFYDEAVQRARQIVNQTITVEHGKGEEVPRRKEEAKRRPSKGTKKPKRKLE